MPCEWPLTCSRINGFANYYWCHSGEYSFRHIINHLGLDMYRTIDIVVKRKARNAHIKVTLSAIKLLWDDASTVVEDLLEIQFISYIQLFYCADFPLKGFSGLDNPFYMPFLKIHSSHRGVVRSGSSSLGQSKEQISFWRT